MSDKISQEHHLASECSVRWTRWTSSSLLRPQAEIRGVGIRHHRFHRTWSDLSTVLLFIYILLFCVGGYWIFRPAYNMRFCMGGQTCHFPCLEQGPCCTFSLCTICIHVLECILSCSKTRMEYSSARPVFAIRTVIFMLDHAAGSEVDIVNAVEHAKKAFLQSYSEYIESIRRSTEFTERCGFGRRRSAYAPGNCIAWHARFERVYMLAENCVILCKFTWLLVCMMMPS